MPLEIETCAHAVGIIYKRKYLTASRLTEHCLSEVKLHLQFSEIYAKRESEKYRKKGQKKELMNEWRGNKPRFSVPKGYIKNSPTSVCTVPQTVILV
jgi:hypothetical protein